MQDAVTLDEAVRGRPDQGSSTSSLLARLRSPGTIAAFAVWNVACTVVTTWVTSMSNERLEQARAATVTPSLWYQSNQDLMDFVCIIPPLLGLLLLATPLQWISKLSGIILLTAAMIGSSALVMRGYVTVADNQVTVRPSLPWRSDVHFRLADTTVVSRGCHTWRGRSGVYHDIIFHLQDGPSGRTISLDQPAGRRVKRWLAVMRAYADRPISPAAATAQTTAPDRDCMSYLLSGLDTNEATELTRLLS